MNQIHIIRHGANEGCRGLVGLVSSIRYTIMFYHRGNYDGLE